MSEKSQVHALIENPKAFDKISSQYDDEVDCYEKLLTQAKRSLETFEDYAEFYSICLEHGPTSYVQNQLESNAVRSLKNMVLRTSHAGKRFPIHTAAQFDQRVKIYQELGIESVTQRSAAFTLLEHVFDLIESQDREEDEAYAYKILSQLLCEQPSPAGELTAILVRARFVIGSMTVNRRVSLDTFAEEMFVDFPDPRKNDEATAAEQLEKSQRQNYEDSKKIELAASALSRDGNIEILEEYLYLTAREVPEQYRHGGDNPWRGELQLAIHQWNCILSDFSETYSSERRARSRSYRHIVQAELSSGGRWQSQRDYRSLPEPNFFAAAKNYFNAAVEIRDIDPVRYVKYVSKSFCNQATAANYREWGPCRGWLATQKIHQQAVEFVINAVDEFNENKRLNETLSETVARHNFREHRAAAVVAFEQRDIERISGEIEAALAYTENVLDSPRQGLIDVLEELEEALLFEEAGEFTEALRKYQTISHPKLDVEKRVYLVEIKQAIDSGQYTTAKETAENEFGETPIYTAIALGAGEAVSSPAIQPPVLDGVSAIDVEAKWSLTYLVHLFSTANTGFESANTEQIILQL